MCVKNLQQKHNLLESDILAHHDRVQAVQASADDFQQKGAIRDHS